MTEILSREQGQALLAKPKRKKSKFKNIRIEIDGIRFASKKEGRYYSELKIRETAGEVGGVELQRRFALLGQDGTLICVYVADFCFWDHVADRFRCIDVKGVETDVFKIKRRLMKACLGIDVEVVK
jgi:hypothetical protein